MALETHVSFGNWKAPDFDRKPVRKAVRRAAMDVRKTARRLVNRKGVVSAPGEMPGRTTGALFRAIKYKQYSPFRVVVAPYRTPELMRKGTQAYYPAFLAYGTPTIRPRGDFITGAMDDNRAKITRDLQAALADALKWVPSK